MSCSLEDLARGVAAGERRALARALSLAERDATATEALLARLVGVPGRAHVIGITGPPGAGKSTLVGAMLRLLLRQGMRVAVLAVDPSSPVTGGALLGDRFRIGEAVDDERAFIRSTATRGSLGGLTDAARHMVQLMDAAGFDLIMLETVGTGQSEVDVAALADSLLVVFPPGLGDEMQAIKAGILELADLLVVTKSDTTAAQSACQALRNVAPLWRNAPPIHPVSAQSDAGIADLVEAVLSRARNQRSSARKASATTQANVREVFERLWNGLERHLPPDMATGLTMRWPGGDANVDPSRLVVVVGAGPGNDAFRLGVIAGALGALATAAGLVCGVERHDLATGRLYLLLERSAWHL